MIVVSLLGLEYARTGVQITQSYVGQTPVTEYAMAGADGPVVVVAHGFAGSQQMMQGYALPPAQAGYRVFAFDFLGHGRNPSPMAGDVTSAEGTTRLLVDQTSQVIDAVTDGRAKVALLGHSMATDILVRVAAERSDIGPIVLISAFSNQITATTPDDLLLIAGAWEPGLRDFALSAVQMVDPAALPGTTAQNGTVLRRGIVAPFVEHVSVLQSRAGRREAVDWIDRSFGRTSAVGIPPTGWAILGLLAGLVLIFRRVAGFVPVSVGPDPQPRPWQTAVLILLPAILAPVIAVPLNPHFLPVLVADYLGLHLFIYGALQLGLLKVWGLIRWRLSGAAFVVQLAWCAVFGIGLDRYAANFWPTSGRLWIIAVLLIGAVPYMLGDAILTARSGLLGRFCIRAGFLASLGLAVALNFKALFFLVLIAPVMVLFYLVYGTMGRDVALRAGPISTGLALGVVLAWALGVSFPLFQS
ncbi:MAG: alpha/beta fold hydrolase [Candidatus Saccharibacteria bacterium]|nr:alpha/beta fold hydrolase [Pseudorhodobacter sp.]